jgi:hypothetical protein
MSYCARHATINLTRLIAQHCFFLACAADECLGKSNDESNQQGQSSSSSKKCTERQDKMLRHLQQPTECDEFINITAEADNSQKYPILKFNETCGGVSDVIARRLLGAMDWLKVSIKSLIAKQCHHAMMLDNSNQCHRLGVHRLWVTCMAQPVETYLIILLTLSM